MLEVLNKTSIEDFYALLVIKREKNIVKIRRALSISPFKVEKLKALFMKEELIIEGAEHNTLALTEKGEERFQYFAKEMRFYLGDLDTDVPNVSPEPDYKKLMAEADERSNAKVYVRKKKSKEEPSEKEDADDERPAGIQSDKPDNDEAEAELDKEPIKADIEDDDEEIDDEAETFTVPEDNTEDEIKEPLIIFTENPEEYDDNVLVEAEKDEEDDKTI